ncbi:serine hydrolase domain-containing protein [Agrobacterium sp. ES01]|uniref:serine hydrolase domain-containing protein n=1 Tax=Agrobacterium sp. ES01 TaxID=3420714 RepID=UPI003D107934
MAQQTNWRDAESKANQFAMDWGSQEPGGAIVAFDASGIRFAVANGLASLSSGASFTPKTVVRYASVTKHAFACLVLSHPELIALDDPLGKHVPELKEPLASVTVGQALDMSGGLPDARECFTLLGLSVYTDTQAQPILDYLARLERLNYVAGTEVSYSNTGYRLVEAALERRGIFFRDFIQTRSAALGVEMDAPDVWNDTVKGLAPGYWHDGKSWQLASAGLHISASGSMTGSAEALATWAKALMLGEGDYAGVLDALSAERHLNDGRATGYGLGLRTSMLGERSLVGHGGSHPGYKSHFLIDRKSGVGIAVVTNREDANGFAIAFETLATLLGEPLPTVATSLPDGIYVAEAGPLWAEVNGSAITCLDAGETLYEDGDGWVSSRSASLPIRLKANGDAIEGWIGHVACRLDPAGNEPVSPALAGHWSSDEGASFKIENGELIMGVGPTRSRMPLRGLGKGRYLFSLVDGPWKKRVCLHVIADNRVELVLSRARMIEYVKAG